MVKLHLYARNEVPSLSGSKVIAGTGRQMVRLTDMTTWNYYRPQSWEGYVFTGVCLSTGGIACSWGGCLVLGVSARGGACSRRCLVLGCLLPGGAWSQGVPGPGGVSAPGGCLILGGCLLPGGCLVPGGVPGPGGGLLLGGLVSQHALRQTSPPGETTTAVDGTHPTGKHSCYSSVYADGNKTIMNLRNCEWIQRTNKVLCYCIHTRIFHTTHNQSHERVWNLSI